MSINRSLELSLSGFGVPATVAHATVRRLGVGARARRASVAFGAGLLMALLTLPIPIVHFFFPPFALVTGTVLAVKRFGQRELFLRVEGTCPFCGRSGRLGLGEAPVRLPRALHCPDCRKALDLEVRSAGG